MGCGASSENQNTPNFTHPYRLQQDTDSNDPGVVGNAETRSSRFYRAQGEQSRQVRGHKEIRDAFAIVLNHPMLDTSASQTYLMQACDAWGCSEDSARSIMQELVPKMPRQLKFDADFWPTLLVTVQRRIAAGTPLSADFFVDLTHALATLGSHDINMMRVDFIRFPVHAPPPDDMDVRFIHVGPGPLAPKLLFKFSKVRRGSAFPSIAGETILIIDVVIPQV